MSHLAVCFFITFNLAAPSFAADQSNWIVLGDAAGARTAFIKERRAVSFAKIAPVNFFRLDGDVIDEKKKILILKDTLMIGINDGSKRICEMFRKKGNEYFNCISDTNGDGNFESSEKTLLDSEIFFIAHRFHKKLKLNNTVSASMLSSTNDLPELFIEIYFEDKGLFSASSKFLICVQKKGLTNVLGQKLDGRMCDRSYIEIKDSEMPYTMNLYGGTIAFLSRSAENGIELKITPPTVDTPL